MVTSSYLICIQLNFSCFLLNLQHFFEVLKSAISSVYIQYTTTTTITTTTAAGTTINNIND